MILQVVVASLLLQAAPSDSPEVELQREQLRAHYQRVEFELRTADTSTLAVEQRQARAEAIDVLHAYRIRGDFGRATYSDERRMYFVDPEQRRCAVAEILHHFGEQELIDDVASTLNDAFVYELRENRALNEFLTRVGLSRQEAERIQGPAVRVGRGPTLPRRNLEPRAAGAMPASPAPGSMAGPANPSSATGARPGAARPGAAVSPRPDRTSQTSTGTSAAEIDLMSHWWTWWEYNKLEWLLPPSVEQERVDPYAAPAHDASRTLPVEGRYRDEIAPLLAAALADRNAQVRGAATVAYARVAGSEALEALLPMLKDASVEVRNQTLLALGAVDDERAVHELLQIAHSGKRAGEVISQDARPIAMVALALARQRGFGKGSESMLPAARGTGQDRDVADARAMQAFVDPATTRGADLRALSGLFDGDKAARRVKHPNERALEALRFDADDNTLEALLHAVGSRDVEVRRSTAATLGTLGDRVDGGVLAPLMSAFELEKEPLTRGLLLIAMGRHGGVDARRFLEHQLTDGHRAQRPWCAMALGVLARESGQAGDLDRVREVLRREVLRQKNQDWRGAYVIALGLARDLESQPFLLDELTGANQESRTMAAIALGMLGTTEASEALRSALAEERSPFARAALAQGLALVREPSDIPSLVGSLHELRVPDEATQHAAAMSFHGSPELTPHLAKIVEDASSPAVTRAAAIQSIGILLDDVPSFRLAALARDTNYSVFPAWLDVPLQSTL